MVNYYKWKQMIYVLATCNTVKVFKSADSIISAIILRHHLVLPRCHNIDDALLRMIAWK